MMWYIGQQPDLSLSGSIGLDIRGIVKWMDSMESLPLYAMIPIVPIFVYINTLENFNDTDIRGLRNGGGRTRPDSLDHHDAGIRCDLIARRIIKYRRIFQTDQGYLGLGPAWMEPGDQVVMFDGCVSPFILRRFVDDNQDGGTKPPEKWKLVGDYYLLG
jgi:hypothetical protein